jgi:transposase-like protein
MTTDKRGVSALLLQRQLGLSCYETAWMMLHKLRRAMVNAVREPLHGEVEVDDTWVGGEQAGLRGSRQLKNRRAALVLVAVEKRGQASGRVRMNVIADFKASTIIPVLTRNVAPGSTIHTDGLKSFAGLVEAALRANIAETTLLALITEQGENRNQREKQWNLSGSPHGFACRGT